MPSPREQPPPQNRKSRRPETVPAGWLWIVFLIMVVGAMYFTIGTPTAGLIDYSKFMELAEAGKFDKVVLRKDSNRMTGEFRS